MMIEKKREIIIRELDNVSESILDGILAIIEESKETDEKMLSLL